SPETILYFLPYPSPPCNLLHSPPLSSRLPTTKTRKHIFYASRSFSIASLTYSLCSSPLLQVFLLSQPPCPQTLNNSLRYRLHLLPQRRLLQDLWPFYTAEDSRPLA
ncbi:hypothetical protein AMTR_s00081p00161420, partial [Amborella trichopoda]